MIAMALACEPKLLIAEPKLRSFGPGHVAGCHFPLQSPSDADAVTPGHDRHRRVRPLAPKGILLL
jgi:hypothetical protein